MTKSRITLLGVLSAAVGLFLACGGVPTPSTPTSSGPSTSAPSETGEVTGGDAAPGGDAEPAAADDPQPADADPAAKPRKEVGAPKEYKTGQDFSVGYTSYRVDKVWWQDYLSANQFLNQKPNAAYLFVQLGVRNNDTKARMIPPFKLIDESRSEYEASPHGWAVEGSIGVLDSLNPSVTKHGFLVFDVPPGRKYRLLVSGGYWSTEDALVELSDPETQAREQDAAEAKARQARQAAKRAEEKQRAELVEKAKWRTWTTADGKHSIEAKFVRGKPDVVTLEKADGTQIDVETKKLSEADRDFITKRPWVNAGK